MSKKIGRKVDMGIGKEGTRGTGVSPTYWVPKVDTDFDDKTIEARSVAGVGTLEDSEEKFVTTKHAEGNISGEVRSKSFGLWLLSLFGTVSTAGPTDSAYTHSFSLQDDSQHDSLSIVVKDPDTTDLYRLSVVNSIEINMNLDEVVGYTVNVMGKTATGASETVSYVAEDKFTKKHLSFKLAATIAGLAGASAISLKSLRLMINANVEMDDVLGTAEPEDFLNKQWGVEGDFTLNYEDETYKEYMRAGTSRAMEIKLVNTDTTIGAGAINPSLTFQMPKVDFFEWTPNYALDEIVTQTESFKASRDIANTLGSISTCDLVNDVVSY